jgi:hypothetical protein
MREPFAQRAQEMGLTVIGAHKGLFTYSDMYSEIAYRQLYTGFINISEDERHPTDGTPVPIISIFTRPTADVDFNYVGYVSDFYQFIGNETLMNRVRQSIQSVGIPIVTENPIMSWDHTRMRNEIIIQSSQQHPQAGDVLPVMVVNNSYNGTRAATVAFGLAMEYNNDRTIFAFSLGELRQVHIQSSTTEMRSAITSYMGVFTDNITDMITQSFNNQVTENEMLAVLDVIEKYGNKRRDAISALLEEIQPAEAGLPSSWQIFLAIVRYSSFEPNLNIKRLLENAAESVLVIPPRMYDVLEQI